MPAFTCYSSSCWTRLLAVVILLSTASTGLARSSTPPSPTEIVTATRERVELIRDRTLANSLNMLTSEMATKLFLMLPNTTEVKLRRAAEPYIQKAIRAHNQGRQQTAKALNKARARLRAVGASQADFDEITRMERGSSEFYDAGLADQRFRRALNIMLDVWGY